MKYRNNLAATVATVALLSGGGAISASVHAETFTDSAGTSVNVGGRSAARSVRSGVTSGGVSGSDITVVPRVVKDIYSDLKSLFSPGQDSISGTCLARSIYSEYYTGSSNLSNLTKITNYSGTKEFGRREYIRNDGSYLQFKGRSNSNGSRVYKTPVDKPVKANSITSNWVRAEVEFDRFKGYKLEFLSPTSGFPVNKSSTFFNDSHRVNLRDYVGQRDFIENVTRSMINHPIIGYPTVTFMNNPTGTRGYKYLHTNRFSGSYFQYLIGVTAKFPGGRTLNREIKVDDIEHIKSADGRYTNQIRITFQNLMVGDHPFYAGRSVVDKEVLRLNDMYAGDNCGGYGCFYDDFTVRPGKRVYASDANPNPAVMPFRHVVTCTMN